MSKTPIIPPAGRQHRPDARDSAYPMRAALAPRAAVVAPLRRRWTLRRAWQLDQGNTPQCVAFSGKHWEISQPICSKVGDSGFSPGEIYAQCKTLDGWPESDGTDARSLLKVYHGLGKIDAYHWYDGDMEALRLWLLTRGPVLLGSFWTESMLQPGPSGVLDVSGEFQYGHEVLLLGYDRTTYLWELVNSWAGWGVQQRAWIHDADLERLLAANGDAVGAVEKKK